MPRSKKPTLQLGRYVASAADPDHIDLYEAMAIADCSRTTIYRHPELPRFKVPGQRRMQTSRAAAEALARRRGIEVREVLS